MDNAIGHRLMPSPVRFRALRVLGRTIMWLILALLTLWAVAALYVDFRIAALRIPVTAIYVLGILAILLMVKRPWAAVLCFAGFCIVLAWWLSLRPSNEGNWQPDADRTAWAEISGDRVVIHNLRNCDYRTKKDYTNCWSDRTVYCRNSVTQTLSSSLGYLFISATRLSASSSATTTISPSRSKRGTKWARITRRYLDFSGNTS